MEARGIDQRQHRAIALAANGCLLGFLPRIGFTLEYGEFRTGIHRHHVTLVATHQILARAPGNGRQGVGRTRVELAGSRCLGVNQRQRIMQHFLQSEKHAQRIQALRVHVGGGDFADGLGFVLLLDRFAQVGIQAGYRFNR